MTVDLDLTIIDDLGVTAVAKALDISREAVRQWRLRGTIPDHRRAELRRLMTNDIGSDGRPGWPSLPTRLPMVIEQRSADHCDSLIDLATIAGPDAKSKVEAAIASPDLSHRRRIVYETIRVAWLGRPINRRQEQSNRPNCLSWIVR